MNKNLQAAKKELNRLRKNKFADADPIIKLSRKVSTLQSKVAKGALGANMETAAELQAIGSALADIKTEALTQVGGAAAEIDREKIQQEARDDLLREIISLLENALSPGCFADAQEVIMEEFGE